MGKLLKIPYGMASFNASRLDGMAYVDKTKYIEEFEKFHVVYPFIVSPGRFGKSLFCNMLQAYYDRSQAGDFEKLFKDTYIFEHRTPSQGQFYVFKVSFAGIFNPTGDTKRGFAAALHNAAADFTERYPAQNSEASLAQNFTEPAEFFSEFCNLLKQQIGRKLYVIIDEYDQFSSELLSKDVNSFRELTSKEGWLKNFYTKLKDATETVVSRVFITGVTSISLDSMTSGFNIAENITFDPYFAGMFGFTEIELRKLIPEVIDLEKYGHSVDEILARMQDYYNGYCFAPGTELRVFNPSMCLYYLRHIARHNSEPQLLLDPAVAADLSKIHAILRLGDVQQAREIVEAVLNGHPIPIPSFEQTLNLNSQGSLSYSQLLSVLVYMGFLTFSTSTPNQLRCPNKAVRTQFFQYYFRYLEGLESFGIQAADVAEGLRLLCQGDPRPLFENVALKLRLAMGLHSYAHFSESNIQTAIQFAVSYGPDFKVQVEPEILGIGYADLLLTPTAYSRASCSYLIELKYVKKGAAEKTIQEKLALAREQLERYSSSEGIRELSNLRQVAAVFSGAELAALEIR